MIYGRWLVAAGLILASAMGCARAGGPPGGVPDVVPPRVVSTGPDTFAILQSPPTSVTIEFDKRISERPTSGSLNNAVLVSPQTGDVRVRHQRRGLEVSLTGGFRSDVVYQITVLPVINDMFRNTLREPYEFFFSTGPDFEPTLLAGLVSDRLTGLPVPEARVDAIPEGDTLAFSAATDSEGVFSLRYIPPGPYRLVAYQDRNRNRGPDFAEPQDSALISLGPADTTVVLDLALLQPDTTPAVLMSAERVDSTTVRLTFDDHLDPELPLDELLVTLQREDGPAPSVQSILHEHELAVLQEAEREAARAEADTALVDRLPPLPDTLPPADRPGIRAAPNPGDRPEAPAPGAQPLPGRSIVLILAEPLEPGADYRVTVSGVRNIQGVPGGGGETTFTVPVPPLAEPEPDGDIPTDTIPPDTTSPAGGSSGAETFPPGLESRGEGVVSPILAGQHPWWSRPT